MNRNLKQQIISVMEPGGQYAVKDIVVALNENYGDELGITYDSQGVSTCIRRFTSPPKPKNEADFIVEGKGTAMRVQLADSERKINTDLVNQIESVMKPSKQYRIRDIVTNLNERYGEILGITYDSQGVSTCISRFISPVKDKNEARFIKEGKGTASLIWLAGSTLISVTEKPAKKQTRKTSSKTETVSEKLPNYRTHKKELFEKQKTQTCGGTEETALCHSCLKSFSWKNLHVDHKVPRSKGGTDHIDNLHLLCGGCNLAKSDKTMSEFKPDWEAEVIIWRMENNPGYVKMSKHRQEISDRDHTISRQARELTRYEDSGAMVVSNSADISKGNVMLLN